MNKPAVGYGQQGIAETIAENELRRNRAHAYIVKVPNDYGCARWRCWGCQDCIDKPAASVWAVRADALARFRREYDPVKIVVEYRDGRPVTAGR